ncbi:hypothetical protein HYPP_02642 [Hyphomicrobium sp. ghe19]|nr:hypothetical protein HYPP_02642 [Hyphomicrobium sp. ghe19]
MWTWIRRELLNIGDMLMSFALVGGYACISFQAFDAMALMWLLACGWLAFRATKAGEYR